MIFRPAALAALLALAACAASEDHMISGAPDFSADVADMMAANGCVASEDEVVGFALAADHTVAEAEAALDSLRRDGLLSMRADGRYDLTGYGDCV